MLRRDIKGWYSLSSILKECGQYKKGRRSRLADAVKSMGFSTRKIHVENRVTPCVIAAHRDAIIAAFQSGFFGSIEGTVQDVYTRIENDSYYDLNQLVRLPAKKVKARCYLDAHRGQSVGDDIQSSGSWRGEVLNYCPTKKVADINWFTGCTPEVWAVAKDIPAEPLYVWLYLLGGDYPRSVSERELAQEMGLVRIHGGLDHLENARLITRAPMRGGTTQEIIAVHTRPCLLNGQDKDVCRTKSINAIRLTTDERKEAVTVYKGQITQFCRDRNLNRGGILRVIQGKQKEYRGWRLA